MGAEKWKVQLPRKRIRRRQVLIIGSDHCKGLYHIESVNCDLSRREMLTRPGEPIQSLALFTHRKGTHFCTYKMVNEPGHEAQQGLI